MPNRYEQRGNLKVGILRFMLGFLDFTSGGFARLSALYTR